jgi:Secretion system C-terminal sorting domain
MMRDARALHKLNASLVLVGLLILSLPAISLAEAVVQDADDQQTQIDPRIWSISYWQQLAAQGLVEVAPDVPFAPGTFLLPDELDEFVDGPDVCTTGELPSHQSENSIFVDPNDPDIVLNSNNSSDWPLGNFYGVSSLYSMDAGATYGGLIDGWGGGDPAVVIDHDGYWYHGHIGSNQNGSANGVTVSLDQGGSYTTYEAGASGGAFLDKNHLWIDNTGGQYDGRLYASWTSFGGAADDEIEVVWSGDNGQTWNNRQAVSTAVNAGYLNQGVNLDVGPNGEVYANWTIYDDGLVEESMGFAKSLDGGVTWAPATRIIDNIYGIRSYNGMDQNHRKNSFPVMTVDVSDGPNNGTIYVAWTNVGVPGINSGPDVASWMIKSTDQGSTWSDPTRIQTDDPNAGNQHYFIWIHCDPITGTLNAIWYDNRDTAGGAVETWIGYSYDGGAIWEDYRTSDVSFTPAPIPGFATGYFGDYLGIYGYAGIVYPCWTDNRDGVARTYVSPYVTEQPPVSIRVTPFYTPPVIVPNGGGTIVYDASVSYNLEVPNAGQVWTEALLPNGSTYALDIYNINFTPDWSFSAENLELVVPGGAPNGIYQFIAKIGVYPNVVGASDQFEFRKIMFDADGGTDWSSSDWFELAGSGEQVDVILPSEFGINSVTPNPFNPEALVAINLPETNLLTVRVFNTLGREVAVLNNSTVQAGTHNFTVDGTSLASGIYFVQAEAMGMSAMRKVTLLK